MLVLWNVGVDTSHVLVGWLVLRGKGGGFRYTNQILKCNELP